MTEEELSIMADLQPDARPWLVLKCISICDGCSVVCAEPQLVKLCHHIQCNAWLVSHAPYRAHGVHDNELRLATPNDMLTLP